MKAKKIVLPIIFTVIFFCGLYLLYGIFSWKDTAGDYFDACEQLENLEKNTVDVAFVGPSRTYCAVNPAVIWNNYGYSSFDMAVSGMDMWGVYYYLKELCKNQSPSVVFLEASALCTDEYQVKGNLYRNAMAMDLSFDDYRLISRIAGEDKWDYILRWPIIHSRYKELTEKDFYNEANLYCMGYASSFDVMSFDIDADAFYSTDVTDFGSEKQQVITLIEELAVEKGFKTVYYMSPADLSLSQRMEVNGLWKYLDEKGLEHIDLNMITDGLYLNYQTDFSDRGHCNEYGAEKVSRYLAEYAAGKTELTDHRGDERYSAWDRCLDYSDHLNLFENIAGFGDVSEVVQEIYASRENSLTVAIVMNGNCYMTDMDDDLKAVLSLWGIPMDGMYLPGGVWIYQNGNPVITTQGYAFSDYLWLNDNKTIAVECDIREDQYFSTLKVGTDSVVTDNVNGIYMVVYDSVLDEIKYAGKLY